MKRIIYILVFYAARSSMQIHNKNIIRQSGNLKYNLNITMTVLLQYIADATNDNYTCSTTSNQSGHSASADHKNVFRDDFIAESDVASLIATGRLFHLRTVL